MADTYLSFVTGYAAFLVLLFGVTGLILKKVLRLEKEIAELKSNQSR